MPARDWTPDDEAYEILGMNDEGLDDSMAVVALAVMVFLGIVVGAAAVGLAWVLL